MYSSMRSVSIGEILVKFFFAGLQGEPQLRSINLQIKIKNETSNFLSNTERTRKFNIAIFYSCFSSADELMCYP